ncbi:MAG: hypothetical protein DIU79_16865 [Actinobacteria bacterium]|nr:MAG: hypothetical protein DIU79_16865 [Actinomycetota bacterium]
MNEVRVDPAVLERAARVCDDMRAQVRVRRSGITADTEEAASGLPGWQTRRALEELSWAWGDDLRKLAGYLEKYGEALRGCARDYRHTDVANAARLDIRGR